MPSARPTRRLSNNEKLVPIRWPSYQFLPEPLRVWAYATLIRLSGDANSVEDALPAPFEVPSAIPIGRAFLPEDQFTTLGTAPSNINYPWDTLALTTVPFESLTPDSDRPAQEPQMASQLSGAPRKCSSSPGGPQTPSGAQPRMDESLFP